MSLGFFLYGRVWVKMVVFWVVFRGVVIIVVGLVGVVFWVVVMLVVGCDLMLIKLEIEDLRKSVGMVDEVGCLLEMVVLEFGGSVVVSVKMEWV